MFRNQKSVITLMGQAETNSEDLQKSIESQLSKQNKFIEDMTPQERAKFYKQVLNVF